MAARAKSRKIQNIFRASSSQSSSAHMALVHRCRFVEYTPRAVHCIALHQGTHVLRAAVSRANADIEIWNITDTWHCERVIPGGEHMSVEALVWSGDRLFSAGKESGRQRVIGKKRFILFVIQFIFSFFCFVGDVDVYCRAGFASYRVGSGHADSKGSMKNISDDDKMSLLIK